MGTSQNEYMLLFRGAGWDKKMSRDELQTLVTRFTDWFDWLDQLGVVKAGQALMEQGRTISGAKGQTVLDGPFAESKESIAGFFIIRADNFDAAMGMAKKYPGLEYGMTVEVRQMAQACPAMQLTGVSPSVHATA
jgi:hypothetical protein